MRRDFLKLCGLAETRAAEKKDEPYGGPYYVVFNASGGWDTTYLMDPKGVNGINRLYRGGDILTKGAHKFAPITKHPAGRGPDCPLAFLTFGNYSATGNLVAMSRVPYLPSLRKIASADAIDGNERSPYHDPFALDRIERALREGHESAAAQPQLPRAERGGNML